MAIRREDALAYHASGRPGKIQVVPTKPFKDQRDLSLAYTPGVAEPCRESRPTRMTPTNTRRWPVPLLAAQGTG